MLVEYRVKTFQNWNHISYDVIHERTVKHNGNMTWGNMLVEYRVKTLKNWNHISYDVIHERTVKHNGNMPAVLSWMNQYTRTSFFSNKLSSSQMVISSQRKDGKTKEKKEDFQ